jgi:hypothetical protein
MAECINALHRVGITHRDIHEGNFVDSRIMDFSTSWTVPNIRLDRNLGWDAEKSINEADMNDYFMFDNMIEQHGGDYRMTVDKKYYTVPKSIPKQSASESSDEEVEIPILERMKNNAWQVLASTYGWKTMRPAISRPDLIDPDHNGGSGVAATEPPSAPLSTRPDIIDPQAARHSNTGTGGAPAGLPYISLSSRPRYRGPDPKLPPFTMLWSWSAAPYKGLDAKKLKDIRELAEGITRGDDTSGNSTIKGRAEDILKIIDDFNKGVAGDVGGDDASPDTSEAKEKSKKRQRTK